MSTTTSFQSIGQGRKERRRTTPFSPTAFVALLQGLYFVLTGVWPLVSIDTFQMVTGPKTDLWLVQTVGVLITVIGVVLLAAVWRRRATAEVILLASISAVAMIGVDVIFVSLQVIDRIYLIDAAVEAVLVAMWMVALIVEVKTMWNRTDRCV